MLDVHYYFAYGSNMNPGRVKQRKMSFLSAEAGLLHDHELRFNKRSVKYPGAASANVVSVPGGVTEGVIYKLESPDQIEAMDPFEGYPIRYNRLAQAIQLADRTEIAWVYHANESHIQEGLQPASWYLAHLLAGRAFLTPEYAVRLAQTECLPDSEIET